VKPVEAVGGHIMRVTLAHTPRRICLAARYSRNPEMQGVRDVLQGLGHTVTSRWIDCHAGKYLTSFTPDHLNKDPEYCSTLAQHDLEDLVAADTVISRGGAQ
jgi:hypothetical protein